MTPEEKEIIKKADTLSKAVEVLLKGLATMALQSRVLQHVMQHNTSTLKLFLNSRLIDFYQLTQ